MDFRLLILQRLSNGVELLGAVVLFTGCGKGMWGFSLPERRDMRRLADDTAAGIARLRPRVGRYILLGLDFYMVSDILSSMMHPGWQELVSLVMIGMLRTILGYFLSREIEGNQL